MEEVSALTSPCCLPAKWAESSVPKKLSKSFSKNFACFVFPYVVESRALKLIVVITRLVALCLRVSDVPE